MTPAILFVTVFVAGLSNYFVYGPISKGYKDFIVPSCRDYWWVDATLFTNLITYHRNKLCEDYGDCDKVATSVSIDGNLQYITDCLMK